MLGCGNDEGRSRRHHPVGLPRDLNISYGEHFWQRVAERVPGFTSLDALNVLKRGKIVSGPTWNDEHRNYRVRVRGASDHGQVTIVLAIRILDDAFGVTIFTDDRR